MFTHYEELCDTGLWDENNYCVHCSEQTYQCSQCNTDLECTHCSAEMADGNDVTFSPYTNPNGELSCLIPACVQTDPENYLKCIECDQDESNPLFFLARQEGVCVPDCAQIEDGHYKNDLVLNVCICENDHYTLDDLTCVSCPFPNCQECSEEKCTKCDNPYFDNEIGDYVSYIIHPNGIGCIEKFIPHCLDKQPRFAIREGFYECDRCNPGYVWHRESHACVPCSDIESFESGQCTSCTRAIPHNDVSQEHYLCKECDHGWFPKANKSDCMFSLGNCSYTQAEYEIVSQVYECPRCD